MGPADWLVNVEVIVKTGEVALCTVRVAEAVWPVALIAVTLQSPAPEYDTIVPVIRQPAEFTALIVPLPPEILVGTTELLIVIAVGVAVAIWTFCRL